MSKRNVGADKWIEFANIFEKQSVGREIVIVHTERQKK